MDRWREWTSGESKMISRTVQRLKITRVPGQWVLWTGPKHTDYGGGENYDMAINLKYLYS